MLFRISVVCLLSQIVYCQYSNIPDNRLPPSCESKIYCESDFLHDVQMARVYYDSKDFVDKKLIYPEEEILEKYRYLKGNNSGQVPSESELKKFIDENMEDGDELEEWTPPDFNESPLMATRVKDPIYYRWFKQLNDRWRSLARKVKDEVRTQPDRYSLIYVPNGFIIPGGRFKELYYWDTYWIVQGLLLCDMDVTARGVIDNIILMVNEFGFMPNGGRKYYLNRSQPPMLILMAMNYYEKTKEFGYRERVVYKLEKEFLFWMKNRRYTFRKGDKEFTMYRYYAPSRGPRPESYREDYEQAEAYKTLEKKNDFYTRIKTGAESGWDFSSRWFIADDGSNHGILTDVDTPNIVPVDLNSIMHVNARILSSWFKQAGDFDRADFYNMESIKILNDIHEVMWRPDRGVWFDWDLKNNKHREDFYVSNIVPLWTGSYNMLKNETAENVLRYLIDQHIIEKDYTTVHYGTPTSMWSSTQQWDYPNAWPPLQGFIILGLFMTGDERAGYMAFELAKVWLKTNYEGFSNGSKMYEKYDVRYMGETGHGGEYEPQFGFGWTNGVVLEILNKTVEYDKNTNGNKFKLRV